jgi:hypothetical protein
VSLLQALTAVKRVFVEPSAQHAVTSPRFCFVHAETLVSFIPRQTVQQPTSVSSNLNFKYLPKINISGKNLYKVLLTITILGITLLIYTIDLKKYLIANQVAVLREDIFSQNISIDKRFKMLANFIYPLSIVSGLIFINSKKTADAQLAFTNADNFTTSISNPSG